MTMGYKQNNSRHIGVFVLFIVGIALTLALYGVKIEAQKAQSDVSQLDVRVARLQTDIDLLEAEIAHLQSPSRLSALAQSELGLSAISVENTLPLSKVASEFPLVENKKGEAAQ